MPKGVHLLVCVYIYVIQWHLFASSMVPTGLYNHKRVSLDHLRMYLQHLPWKKHSDTKRTEQERKFEWLMYSMMPHMDEVVNITSLIFVLAIFFYISTHQEFIT